MIDVKVNSSVALAVRHGCDLNCGDIYPRLREAVRLGLVTEAEITTCAERLFEARFRLGMFDPEERVPFSQLPPEIVHCEAHVAHARQVARESIVLLKNENKLLPLSRAIRSIAVVGPAAATADVLLGNYNGFSPDLVTLLEGIIGAVSVGTQVTYTKGCDFAGQAPINEGHLKTATDSADVIVATLGYSPLLEGEEGDAAGELEADGSGDRTRISLPGRQLELLQKLHALGKPVVLVLTGGSPIELTWAAENIPSVLMVWYPGEQGGRGLADVLFGDYNPAGRLPVTFVKSLEQVPPFTDYAMSGRTYRFMTQAPLYRFGYGLSYTSFGYSNLTLSKVSIGNTESVTVSVTIRNTGARAGDEVVQLYIKHVDPTVPVPLQQLAGMARVHLEAGESRTVELPLRPEQFAAYDEQGRPFIRAGDYRIFVGGGQPDDPHYDVLSARLTIA